MGVLLLMWSFVMKQEIVMPNINEVDSKELFQIALEADRAGFSTEHEATNECGAARVYVEFCDKIRKNGRVSKTLKKAGFCMFSRPHHTGDRIYVGYQNFHGVEMNQARAISAVFNSHGIRCYADADAD